VWESIAESAMQHGGPRTPDVFGLTAQQARRTADDNGFRPVYAGQLVDDSAAFGTVVLQDPPPSERFFLAGQPELDIDLAVSSHEPQCDGSNLRADYYMLGELGDHTDSAAIKIRNIAATPCALANEMIVRGVDAQGNVVADPPA
jgi:hypothetical protein